MAAGVVDFGGLEVQGLEEYDTATSTAQVEDTLETRHPWAGSWYARLRAAQHQILETRGQADPVSHMHVIGFAFRHPSDTLQDTTFFVAKQPLGTHFWLDLHERRIKLYDKNGVLRATSARVLNANTWHEVNVAWKRDGAGVGYVKVYVDGVERISEGAAGDYDGGVGQHVDHWENTSETASFYVDDTYHLHDADENDFLDDFHVIGPFQNNDSQDWSSRGHVIQAWENAQEMPLDGVAVCELDNIADAKVGCSTWEGDRPGPRGTDAANGATARGGKWIFKASQEDPRMRYGRQTVGNENTDNTTLGSPFVGYAQFVDDGIGVVPGVDEWFQIGIDAGAFPPFVNFKLDWCAAVMLVTGGSEPGVGKRATLGTIHKTAREVLAG